ncbi:hypothetical protein ACGLWX_05835 [Halomonas sp. HMF6819]|uniref:hypothetical protein n=1 Tax=Halomonas sp. HMF6819 TaxID=3373085 RepID=UPI0037B876EF
MRLEGVLYNAGGPMASVTVRFRAVETVLNGVLAHSVYEFTADENGGYQIDLEPGVYKVWWNHKSQEALLGEITADAASVMSLPQALAASPTPITEGAAQDLVDQLRAGVDEANEAKTSAQRYAATSEKAAQTAGEQAHEEATSAVAEMRAEIEQLLDLISGEVVHVSNDG